MQSFICKDERERYYLKTSGRVFCELDSQRTGKIYKQYVNFEEYDEELSSFEQNNEMGNSMSLSRQSSQNVDTNEDSLEDAEEVSIQQDSIREICITSQRSQMIGYQEDTTRDISKEQISTTVSMIINSQPIQQEQWEQRLKYGLKALGNESFYDYYSQSRVKRESLKKVNKNMKSNDSVLQDTVSDVFKDIGVEKASDISLKGSYQETSSFQFSNLGILKHKSLNEHLSSKQAIYNDYADSITSLLSDYIISAYSYDFTAIRLQQSNVLIRAFYKIQQILEIQELSKKDSNTLEQMLQSIQQIERRNQEIRSKTVFCCQKVMVAHSDKFLICNSCGKLCNFMKKSVRKDRNEGSQRNTSYHSIRHFDDVFKQLFIQPIEPIDGVTKLQLQEFMDRDHKQKVTIEDVRQYLKQLPSGKGSKLNKSDAFIMGILNGETLKISNIEYQFIKNTFQQFIQILYKNAETRKNTPNCVSFIKKIIDLLYKDIDPHRHQQIVKRLHQQKENTTRKMQKTWQFLVDQFDVKQLKQDFKDTIKKQNAKIHDFTKDNSIYFT